MNILLLTNRDIASNLALNYLYKGLGRAHKFKVLLSARVGGKQQKPAPLQDLAFMEQALFNQVLFPALGTRSQRHPNALLSFADFQQMGIVVEDIHSINCQQGLAAVSAFEPDLIISIRFGLILKAEVLAIPPLGVINLHSGKLPDYRGVMATFRAMLAGEKTISTTLHYISDGSIDTGAIIATHSISLDPALSYLSNTLSLYAGGVDTIIEAVNALDAGHTLEVKQQQGQGNYFSFPSENELDQFFAKGYQLFDYTELIHLAQRYI